MAKIHAGATLTPGFREFLPHWMAHQRWYRGDAVPTLRPIGFYRFEDPAGEVGMEAHLVTDGTNLYHVPLTYRGAPLPDVGAESLLATPEHSVLGTRWIYDAAADPTWHAQVLDLVRTGGVSEPAGRSGVGPAEARGVLDGPLGSRIEVVRVLTPDTPPAGFGVVVGTWHPDGPDGDPVTGCLAVVKI
ncbi:MULTISPECIES: maltokinase N-terminal cap-like domain-containing protein [unclassified Saccharothrix]|uniref:maltokinase N-terminal cap-like domain-containing protein n=1 Tax=unclassified Saccharothrix TaxID=2593673 RepID=UPI00307F7BBE